MDYELNESRMSLGFLTRVIRKIDLQWNETEKTFYREDFVEVESLAESRHVGFASLWPSR
jgi:hypothetical protein